MIGNLIEISLFTLAYFTMLTTIHESKNYLQSIHRVGVQQEFELGSAENQKA